MRLNASPENLFERIALRAGVVPTPLGDTIVAMTLARTIMVATKLGVFETNYTYSSWIDCSVLSASSTCLFEVYCEKKM